MIRKQNFGLYKTYQVPLSKIAELTNLNLEPFYNYDLLSKTKLR